MKKILEGTILKSVRFYQKVLSLDQGIFSIFGQRRFCRFYPSCSEYFYQVIQKYGIKMGCWKGMKRIIRCNPWNQGGNDPC